MDINIDVERLNKMIMSIDMARDEMTTALYLELTDREQEAAELVNGAIGMLDQAMAILHDERIDQ